MTPDGSPIEEKDCLRDLGVRISTDLSFQTQIDSVIQSGSRMAGWVTSEKGKESDADTAEEYCAAKAGLL